MFWLHKSSPSPNGSHRSKPDGSPRHWARTDLEHTRSTRRISATHQGRAGGQISAASPENTSVPGTWQETVLINEGYVCALAYPTKPQGKLPNPQLIRQWEAGVLAAQTQPKPQWLAQVKAQSTAAAKTLP